MEAQSHVTAVLGAGSPGCQVQKVWKPQARPDSPSTEAGMLNIFRKPRSLLWQPAVVSDCPAVGLAPVSADLQLCCPAPGMLCVRPLCSIPGRVLSCSLAVSFFTSALLWFTAAAPCRPLSCRDAGFSSPEKANPKG